MYLVKTPPIVKTIFSDYIWSMDTKDKEVFLTFDDGPVPVVTPWVLDVLRDYSSKATFFCVGENVKKYPHIYERILNEGHAIGNHTYNHLNGWFTDTDTYMDNVTLCDHFVATKLFRPPYGKIRPKQANQIRTEKKIIMWDVLSGDFDSNISADQCLANVMNNFEPGSIIVFHDSPKAEEKLRYALPVFLKHLTEKGFKAIAVPAEVPELVLT